MTVRPLFPHCSVHNWEVRPFDGLQMTVTACWFSASAGCAAQCQCEAESLWDRPSLVSVFCLPCLFSLQRQLSTLTHSHLTGAGHSNRSFPAAAIDVIQSLIMEVTCTETMLTGKVYMKLNIFFNLKYFAYIIYSRHRLNL